MGIQSLSVTECGHVDVRMMRNHLAIGRMFELAGFMRHELVGIYEPAGPNRG
jgi:hypothetical protein